MGGSSITAEFSVGKSSVVVKVGVAALQCDRLRFR
jgi:hypothetical protein